MSHPASRGFTSISVKTLFWLGVCSLLTHCATTENSGAEVPLKVVIEPGLFEENPEPMPAYQPVWRRYMRGDKEEKRELAFKAWDFNGDRIPDLVEVLDASGKVTKRMYDFNLDGKPDIEEDVDPTAP